MDPLRIAIATAEVTPFAKTGGLGDVSAALARYLTLAGHDVRLFMPMYRDTDTGDQPVVPVDFILSVPVTLGPHHYVFSAYTTPLPGTDAWMYLIDCPALYDRPGLYTSDADEHLRFLLFSRAVFFCCQRMGFAPDILHANDWHTGFMPLYLRTIFGWDNLFATTRSVITIHNIGYQGVFPADIAPDLGLDAYRDRLHQDDLQSGVINFLKTGIMTSDLITTVSDTYALEIQTPEYGMGLDGFLREQADRIVGIVNGVDYEVWDPAADPRIPHHYTARDLSGKKANKRYLLENLGLAHDDGAPVVGMVTRLVSQKGIDILYDSLPEVLARHDVRLAVLGSGDPTYEAFFTQLQFGFPEKVSFYRGYHARLAALIEAGSDMFLMPSLYEPCGLNQMYSLRYGSVPIVRRTGGLADTVQLYDPRTGQGTGIVFDHYEPEAVRRALEAAFELYQDAPSWDRLVRNGMAQDYSWERQVGHYVQQYERLLGQNGDDGG